MKYIRCIRTGTPERALEAQSSKASLEHGSVYRTTRLKYIGITDVILQTLREPPAEEGGWNVPNNKQNTRGVAGLV